MVDSTPEIKEGFVLSPSSLYYRFLKLLVALSGRPASLEWSSRRLSSLRMAASGNATGLYRLHLKRVFPAKSEEDLDNVLKEYWKTHERNLFSLFLLDREDPSSAIERVSWRDPELLEEARERGSGVLLLVPHYGDERGLHVLLGMHGRRVHVISSRYLDMSPFCRRSRLAPGLRYNEMHFPDENPRWMYRALQENGIIHYGSTAYGGPGGTWTSGFGVPVLVPSAPWKLWKRTGCSVLFAWCTQIQGMGWEIGFRELETPGDPVEFAGVFTAAAEDLARTNPGQYEWKNLAIRHRETNAIVRTGRIPRSEDELESLAVPRDSDPGRIAPEAALRGPFSD